MKALNFFSKANSILSSNKLLARATVFGLIAASLTTGLSVSQAAVARKASAAALKRELSAIVNNNPAFGDAKTAAYIKVINSDRVVYSYRGQAPMIPASNQKVITTACALSKLGPDYRYVTALYGANPDANGVIHGNVYLRGSGDPTLTPPYMTPCTEPLARFVQALQSSGVKSIDGDLVADDSIFDRNYLPQGWLEHYRLDAYAAPVSGLSLNGNLVDVGIDGNSIVLDPPCSTLKLKLDPGYAGPLAVERERGTDDIIVRGQGGGVHRQITVDNPSLFTIGAFERVLSQTGITYTGKVRLINEVGEPTTVDNLRCYAYHKSVPLHEIVKETNRESDNLFAEHLFRTVGAATSGKGTALSGFNACKSFLQRNNVDTTSMRMVDGCGLSRLNNISPYQLVGTLDAMVSSPFFSYYSDSLPGSGQGTLRSRLGGIEVRAKTGTLNNDSSLSGYVKTAHGDTVAFSLMFNDLDSICPAVDAQDKIVTALSNWPDPL